MNECPTSKLETIHYIMKCSALIIGTSFLLGACGSKAPVETTFSQNEPAADASEVEVPAATAPEEPVTDSTTETGEESDRGAVFFAFDSAKLSEPAKAALESDIDWLMASPGRDIIVHGYTDDTGDSSYNLELGKERAQAVRDYLVSQGIAEGRIVVVSHGENGPEMRDDLERRAVYMRELARN